MVYPNPTRDWLNIDYTSETEEPVLIQVRDMTGRLLNTTQLIPMIGKNPAQVDMSSLSNGIYWIQISQNGTLKFTNRVQKSN